MFVLLNFQSLQLFVSLHEDSMGILAKVYTSTFAKIYWICISNTFDATLWRKSSQHAWSHLYYQTSMNGDYYARLCCNSFEVWCVCFYVCCRYKNCSHSSPPNHLCYSTNDVTPCNYLSHYTRPATRICGILFNSRSHLMSLSSSLSLSSSPSDSMSL